MNGNRFASFDFDHDADYQAEAMKLDIAVRLAKRMDELQISRTELARRLGVSRARVTQILAGYSNLTVATLAAAAAALDTKVYIEFVPNSVRAAEVPPQVADWTPPPAPPTHPAKGVSGRWRSTA